MIETITFNVGGQFHQVSRSLLAMYPDTMLSKLVSEHWCNIGDIDENFSRSDETITTEKKKEVTPNDDDVIFIDRDGRLFRYVLNYLRDGRVVLPITLDMNTFLHELLFYGIELKDNDYSNVTVSVQANAQSVLQINGLISSLEKEECCIRFARLCIIQFKEKGNDVSSSDGQRKFVFIVRSIDYGLGKNKKDDTLYNAVEEVARGGTYMKERSNVHLKRFGLELSRIDSKDVYRQRTKFHVLMNVL